MNLSWGAASHVGMLRQQNEDSFIAEPNVFVVADGMGGHNAGEVASALAVQTLRDAAGAGFGNAEAVVTAINSANTVIHRASGGPSEQRGMGTTLTAVVPLAATDTEPPRVVVANVGDSRVYLWRGDELKQVSADHSYVQELLTEGYITVEEARVHPRRNIVTRALGIEGDVMADSWVLPMLMGDRYLLCSDGLVDEVDDDAIGEVLRTVPSAQTAAERLVSLANENGGRDNVTVIVVDVVEHAMTPTVEPTQPPTPARNKRRLLTAAAGVLAIMLIAVSAVGWYARRGYFVGFDGNGNAARLVVFKGRPAPVLWFYPTVHLDSGVTRDAIFPALANDIAAKPTSYESPDRAVAYVNSIRGVIDAQRTSDGGS